MIEFVYKRTDFRMGVANVEGQFFSANSFSNLLILVDGVKSKIYGTIIIENATTGVNTVGYISLANMHSIGRLAVHKLETAHVCGVVFTVPDVDIKQLSMEADPIAFNKLVSNLQLYPDLLSDINRLHLQSILSEF